MIFSVFENVTLTFSTPYLSLFHPMQLIISFGELGCFLLVNAFLGQFFKPAGPVLIYPLRSHLSGLLKRDGPIGSQLVYPTILSMILKPAADFPRWAQAVAAVSHGWAMGCRQDWLPVAHHMTDLLVWALGVHSRKGFE